MKFANGAPRSRRALLAFRRRPKAFRLAFPDELIKSAPQAVETEKSVFETRTRKIAQDIDVLTQQETRLTENLKLLNREVELTRGFTPRRSCRKSK